MCSPTGSRLLLSISSLHRFPLTKLDETPAFLQTGNAARDVYVMPPRKSSDPGKVLWILVTNAYGLVNANAKGKLQSEAIMLKVVFEYVQIVTQIFALRHNGV